MRPELDVVVGLDKSKCAKPHCDELLDDEPERSEYRKSSWLE